MQCTDFLLLLEREPDGPLPAVAAGHLDRCSECRLLFEDLERIRVAGFEWATEQQPAPAPRVWLALREQLELEGLIRKPQPVRPGRWAGWLHSFVLRPELAGATLTVFLAASALLNVQGRLPGHVERGSMIPPASVRAPWAEEIDRTLDSDMRRVMASLPERSPSLASALQQNLTLVDSMIATCQKSEREQPDNPMVREYLYGAYQQKAVLLSTALEHATLEDR